MGSFFFRPAPFSGKTLPSGKLERQATSPILPKCHALGSSNRFLRGGKVNIFEKKLEIG